MSTEVIRKLPTGDTQTVTIPDNGRKIFTVPGYKTVEIIDGEQVRKRLGVFGGKKGAVARVAPGPMFDVIEAMNPRFEGTKDNTVQLPDNAAVFLFTYLGES